MPVATLTSKGQITIPLAVRNQLHLHTGDKINFSLLDDDVVLLRPVTKSVDEVFGCLHIAAKKKKVSIGEMNAAVGKMMQQGFE